MARATGGLPGETGGMGRGVGGPKFSDYGQRYYTDSLSKQEKKDLHNWRMKYDSDYKNQISREKITKKLEKEKAVKVNKTAKKKK